MNLVDDREIQRFEDDGNKAEPRIGVSLPGSDAILRDARPDRPRHRDRRVVLGGGDGPVGQPKLIVAGCPNGKTFDETPKILDARGEEVSSLTWKGFLSWRKTKCRPYDYIDGPPLATGVNTYGPLSDEDIARRFRGLEEIDQATHEFIGEVAELGQLFLENGPTTFFGEKRAKLIDECGDILFCGVWALDAWGVNPLYEADDLELLRVSDDSDLAVFARAIIVNGEAVLNDRRFVSMMGGLVMNLMLQGQTNAGLTSNSFKKLRFQRREQNVEAQVARILAVLVMVNQLLIVANSSIEEALKVNQRKLDARYPNGYQPGQGGGNRTGEGK